MYKYHIKSVTPPVYNVKSNLHQDTAGLALAGDIPVGGIVNPFPSLGYGIGALSFNLHLLCPSSPLLSILIGYKLAPLAAASIAPIT